MGPISDEEVAELQHRRRVEALDVDRTRLTILEQLKGLTKDEHDAVEAQLIQAQKLLEIEEARGNTTKENLAKYRADVAQLNLELEKMQRTDVFAGLAKGFKDVTRDAGETMQDFARDTARSMSRTFDDLFFNVFTGQTKKLADVGRQLGLSLARSLSGALAEVLTSNLTRGLGGLLGGTRGLMGLTAGAAGGVSLLGGAGLADAGVVSPAGGGYGAGIAQLLSGLTGAGANLALSSGFSAGGALGGLAPGVLTSTSSGFEALGAAQVELALAGVEAGGYAGAYGGYAGSALGLIGSYGGAAIAGVGFLASLYGAYAGRSPGMGAVTGGIGGLGLGASVGSLVSFGWGTAIGAVVGLIAGAALGAGAGGLGQKNGPYIPGGGEQASLLTARNAVTGFGRSLNAAVTGQYLVAALNGSGFG